MAKRHDHYLELDLPLGVEGAVWLKSGPGQRIAPHRHRELELNIVLKGQGNYLVEDQRVTIEQGDLLWLFSAQNHVLYDWSQDFEMWIVVVTPTLIRKATMKGSRQLRQRDPGQVLVRRLGRADLRMLSQLAEQTQQADEPDLIDAALSHLLLDAWHRFQQTAPRPMEDALHPAVAKAARLIRDARDHDYPLNELAHDAKLSNSRLSRLFSEQMGMPISSFRNACRLEQFFDIYGLGNRLTLTEAAYQSGFGSYAQFQRVFKRLTGQSPTTYRKQVGG